MIICWCGESHAVRHRRDAHTTMPRRHRLERPFGRYLGTFERNLTAAVEGGVEPLHDCRVATRRLRELWPLVAAELGGTAARRAARRLRWVGRALGAVREGDVALELLDEVTGDGQTPADATARLRQHLDDLRSVARHGMVVELARANVNQLGPRLQTLVDGLGRASSGAWTEVLALRMRVRGEQLRDAVDIAGVLYVPERLHAVRIAAKKLRYGFELAAEAGATRRRAPARQLKAVQDTLGRLHDMEVLTGLIHEAPLPAVRSLPWVTHVDDLRHRLEAECRLLHSQFIGQRGALYRSADAAAETASRIWSRPAGSVVTPMSTKTTSADTPTPSVRCGFNG